MSKELNTSVKSVNIQIHRIDSKNHRVVIQGLPEDWSELFPYAGVMINQILTQSNLQPVYLAPLDFIQLYRQHQQQQQTQAQQEKAQSGAAVQ